MDWYILVMLDCFSGLPQIPSGERPMLSLPSTAQAGGNQAVTITGIFICASLCPICMARFTRMSRLAVSVVVGFIAESGCQLIQGISTRPQATRKFLRQ